MRKSLGALLLGVSLLLVGVAPASANPPPQAQGPPIGGCPRSGGWTIRSVDEPGAAPLADINGDGWLCGIDINIVGLGGVNNYTDNVIKKTA